MKRGQIGLNQPLIYIHPFPPLSTQFLYLPLFNSANKKQKNYTYEERSAKGICPPASSPSYAYVYACYNLDTFWGTEQIRITSSVRNP
jgi:hypothetical protein